MTKVYIVTSGSYSDYHIDSVFEDEADAEAYCETKRAEEKERWGYTIGSDLAAEVWEIQPKGVPLKIRWVIETEFNRLGQIESQRTVRETMTAGEKVGRRVQPGTLVSHYGTVRAYGRGLDLDEAARNNKIAVAKTLELWQKS